MLCYPPKLPMFFVLDDGGLRVEDVPARAIVNELFSRVEDMVAILDRRMPMAAISEGRC